MKPFIYPECKGCESHRYTHYQKEDGREETETHYCHISNGVYTKIDSSRRPVGCLLSQKLKEQEGTVVPKKKDTSVAIKGRDINIITAEIQFYKNQAGEAILEIGCRLNEAKEQLDHGEWLGWLNDKIKFSEASAQRFMRLAREYPNPSPVTDLGSSKALILLALPSGEREAFVEESHDVGGQARSVYDMSKRELEKAVQERAEAIKGKAEAEAAEAIAWERAEQLATLVVEAEEDANAAKAESERIKAEKNSLEAELENLRKEEVVLHEEPGQQTIEAIRQEAAAEAKKEAEEKLKRKIDKAAKDKADAEKKADAAVADRDRLSKEYELEKAAATEKIEQLQKRLAAASSEHVTVFKTHFDNAQGCINSMIGCIKKLKKEPDTQNKLATALRALCEKTLQNLPSPEAEAQNASESSGEALSE